MHAILIIHWLYIRWQSIIAYFHLEKQNFAIFSLSKHSEPSETTKGSKNWRQFISGGVSISQPQSTQERVNKTYHCAYSVDIAEDFIYYFTTSSLLEILYCSS